MVVATFRPLRVAAVAHDTDDAVVVTFDVPDDDAGELAFEPGQHLTIRHHHDGEELRRSYSICSPRGGPLRIGVRRLPDGRVSGWIHDTLAPGAVVDVLPPSGSFVLDPAPTGDRHHVAVAAGSGITPVLGIVATALAEEPDAVVTLLLVNRSAASAMLLEEVQALKDRYLDRLRLLFVLTREQTDIELLSGRPDRERLVELVAAGLLPTDADRYWLCGPEQLVVDVTEVLGREGVADDRIRHELFGTAEAVVRRPVADSVGARAVVTLGGRTTEVDVGAGEVILDAVRRARPDVPYSCTAGVCATCKARVVEGTVDLGTVHGLAADQVERGFVLTCQAQPTSDSLIVDFDA